MMKLEISEFVMKLARNFSGISYVRASDQLYADLNISGSDAVEFYEIIEKNFGVDLRPVTEIEVEKEGWLKKTRRKKIPRDPTLQELCDFLDTRIS